MGGEGVEGKGAVFPPAPLCSCSILIVGVSQVALFSHPRLSEVEAVSLEQSPLLDFARPPPALSVLPS